MNRFPAWVAVSSVLFALSIEGGAEAAKKPKKPAGTSTTAEPAAPASTGGDFDRGAAASAIAEVSLQKCKATNAAKGDGHVSITFAPAGTAQNAAVDKGPWIGTPVAKCMVREFKKAKVPAFRGDAVTVGKSFRFD